METAKIFWSGRSQAIRLPKQFRFEGGEVQIRRSGNAVILEPIADDWSWLTQVVGPVDADFENALREHSEEQRRDELEYFFLQSRRDFVV
jgi:antitoxin VapB